MEIVFAGLGFVAIGGNFLHAKVKVWSPGGKGVGVRRPIVQTVSGGYRLDVVMRKKVGRLVMLGGKATRAETKPYFQRDVIGAGRSSVKGFRLVKDGEEEEGGEGETRDELKSGDAAAGIEGQSGETSTSSDTAGSSEVQSGDVQSGDVKIGDVQGTDGPPSTDGPPRRELVQESIVH